MPELTVEATGYSGYIMGVPEALIGYFITSTTPSYLAVGHGVTFGAAAYRSFITFDISEVPEDATIESVVLRLVTTGDWWPINVPFDLLLLDCEYPDPVPNGEQFTSESLDAIWSAASASDVLATLLNTAAITDAEGQETDQQEILFELDPAQITPGATRRYAIASAAELAAGDPGVQSIAAFPISASVAPTNPQLIVTYSVAEDEEPEPVVAIVGPALPYRNIRDVRVLLIDRRSAKPERNKQ